MNVPARPGSRHGSEPLYIVIARYLRSQGFPNATAQSVHAAHVRLVVQTLREYRQIYAEGAAGKRGPKVP